MNILVFEPEHAGHQMEFLLLFVERAVKETNLHLSIVLSPKLFSKLQQNDKWKMIERQRKVSLFLLDPVEERRCSHNSLPFRSLWLWYTLRLYIKRSGAESVLSMRVDHFQLALALRLPLGAAFSGILFQPSLHYSDMCMEEGHAVSRLKKLRQKLLYTLMLFNKELQTLFTFDDSFAEWGNKNFAVGEKIKFLPDPAHPETLSIEMSPIINLVPENKTVFLLFGALSRRKGVFALLAALRRMSTEDRQNICVILAGKVIEPERQQFTEQLSMLQHHAPGCCIHIDHFLTESEIVTLIRRCDVVLACYQKFVGSSGILLWAASMDKPVLAQSFGLVGKWVREHHLGMTVDTSDEQSLAHALLHMCDQNVCDQSINLSNASEFVSNHDPSLFAEMLVTQMKSATLV